LTRGQPADCGGLFLRKQVLASAFHIPESLLTQLDKVSGFDKVAFLAAHEAPAVTSVRLHPLKGAAAPQGSEPVPWCTSGYYLPSRPVFTLDPIFHAGAYYVQEASSMFPEYLLRYLVDKWDGLRVLDLCAAPGGKSTLVAALLGENSLLVANEVIRSRAAILEENIARWGYANTWVCSNDPRDFGALHGYFDIIIVDAPCSGSGLFRKDPAALEEWSENNVTLCSQRQQRILADVWPALKEGGLMLYATCSYSPQEDEEIADWLADTFEAGAAAVPVPNDWGIVVSHSPRHGLPCYRFFPDKVKGEGFFITALRKTGEPAAFRYPKSKALRTAGVREQVRPLLMDREQVVVPVADGHYAMIHPAHEADLNLLQSQLFLRRTGLPLGKPAGGEWLPSHELALSVDKSPEIPSIGVSREEALSFLRKEENALAPRPRGWYLVVYEGIALGWLKSLGNRYNNYLPKHWRIRMGG
jgi:16S rRNA C967 or C1407 C5-methylase (RsmB/RsmF family)/NOL1/NOP2/fmu family ribosome biogenesis protein